MQVRVDKHFIIAFAFLVCSFVLFKVSDFSVQTAVNMPLAIMAGSSQTVSIILPLLAMTLFSLGLVVFAASEDSSNHAIRVLLWGAVSVVGLLMFGLNIVFLVFVPALLISIYAASIYYPLLFSEYKKWKYYRATSKVVSISLLVIGLGIALGAFAQTYSDDSYREEFKSSLVEYLVDSQKQSAIPGSENLTPAQRSILENENREKSKVIISQAIEASPLISIFLNGLPLFTAMTVFFSIEFFKIFVAIIVGLAGSVLISRTGLMEHRDIPKKKILNK